MLRYLRVRRITLLVPHKTREAMTTVTFWLVRSEIKQVVKFPLERADNDCVRQGTGGYYIAGADRTAVLAD
jgi:hypothetical protein